MLIVIPKGFKASVMLFLFGFLFLAKLQKII